MEIRTLEYNINFLAYVFTIYVFCNAYGNLTIKSNFYILNNSDIPAKPSHKKRKIHNKINKLDRSIKNAPI
jgi:hypothetical protein